MNKKKIGWFLVVIFCVSLFMPGCSDHAEESTSLTEENTLEEIPEGEEETIEGDIPKEMDEERDIEAKLDENASGDGEASELPDLTGIKAAFLIANGFHDSETTNPIAYLERHGVECTLIGPEIGEVSAYNSKLTLDIEKTIEEASSSDYDLLIIPGGNSPRVLNLNEEALVFVQDFMATEKPVATICRGPYLLAGAGMLEGRTLTAMQYIENDIIEAGGEFVNEAVVVDGNLITSRMPGDLPLFNRAIIEMLTHNE